MTRIHRPTALDINLAKPIDTLPDSIERDRRKATHCDLSQPIAFIIELRDKHEGYTTFLRILRRWQL